MAKKTNDKNLLDLGTDIALGVIRPFGLAGEKIAEAFLGQDLNPSTLFEKSPFYEDKGTEELELLAKNSDAAACYILAKRYTEGTHILGKNKNSAKYWYGKALSNIEHLNVYVISDKLGLAKWLLDNDNIEKAMTVAKNISGHYSTAYFYELLFRKTKEEKFREEAIEKYKAALTEEPIQLFFGDIFELSEENAKELKSRKEIERIESFSRLAGLAEDSRQERHFLIGALKANTIDVKDRFNRVNDHVIKCFDIAYEELKDKGPITSIQDNSSEDMTDMLFSSIDYNERQFIYFAKDLKSLAGCYDESIPWVFTLNKYPKEVHFPVIGHPLPNTIYIAHPAKRGMYIPVENADNELFHDKIRDFRRLSQCLGATEIKFRSLKGHTLSESHYKSMNIEIDGEYKGYEGSVEYGNKKGGRHNESLTGRRELVQRFNPTKAPYVPDDVDWLSIDPEWQSIVKQRKEGNMLHYSMRISSKKTMAITDTRMDEVKLAFKSFIANAHVNYSQQMERSFQREEETEWEINVTFKPLDELIPTFSSNVQNKGVLPNNEQEYIEDIKVFLEDDAEITPRERKMLDRIRQSLGISEERAKELEESLKPQLTDDEKEYLDMYREYIEKGEITEKERRRLNKIANALGINEERIKEIEQSF